MLIILALAAGTLLCIAIYAVQKVEDDRFSDTLYSDAVSRYAGEVSDTGSDTDRYRVFADVTTGLSEQYPDVRAWLNVEGTSISYPVLQSDTNEYYLRRSYTGGSDRNGSIIADYRLFGDLADNRNIVLYGHNTGTGRMLSDIAEIYYGGADGFSEMEIELFCCGKVYVFSPYSVYISGGNSFAKVFFASDEEFFEFVSETKAASETETGADTEGCKAVLTLVTCVSPVSKSDERIVLHAVCTRTETVETFQPSESDTSGAEDVSGSEAYLP